MAAVKRWAARIGIGVVIVAVVVALLLFDFIRSFARSVPSYEGAATVAGLTAPVTIRRDRYAIPHISGSNAADVAFGLGYVHAQDRFFQMDMARHFVAGRLSELVGPLALSTDIQMRAIGLYPAAQQAVDYLSLDARQILSA